MKIRGPVLCSADALEVLQVGGNRLLELVMIGSPLRQGNEGVKDLEQLHQALDDFLRSSLRSGANKGPEKSAK